MNRINQSEILSSGGFNEPVDFNDSTSWDSLQSTILAYGGIDLSLLDDNTEEEEDDNLDVLNLNLASIPKTINPLVKDK